MILNDTDGPIYIANHHISTAYYEEKELHIEIIGDVKWTFEMSKTKAIGIIKTL